MKANQNGVLEKPVKEKKRSEMTNKEIKERLAQYPIKKSYLHKSDLKKIRRHSVVEKATNQVSTEILINFEQNRAAFKEKRQRFLQRKSSSSHLKLEKIEEFNQVQQLKTARAIETRRDVGKYRAWVKEKESGRLIRHDEKDHLV